MQQQVEQSVQRLWPACKVEITGSMSTGLALASSDLGMSSLRLKFKGIFLYSVD